MISPGTLWAAIAVLLSALVAICGGAIFVVNLLISNSASANARQFSFEIAAVKSQFGIDIARMEVKLDAINLSSLWVEITELRHWRHDMAPRQMIYDDAVERLEGLETRFMAHCLVAEGKISDLNGMERRISAIEKSRRGVE